MLHIGKTTYWCMTESHAKDSLEWSGKEETMQAMGWTYEATKVEGGGNAESIRLGRL